MGQSLVEASVSPAENVGDRAGRRRRGTSDLRRPTGHVPLNLTYEVASSGRLRGFSSSCTAEDPTVQSNTCTLLLILAIL